MKGVGGEEMVPVVKPTMTGVGIKSTTIPKRKRPKPVMMIPDRILRVIANVTGSYLPPYVVT